MKYKDYAARIEFDERDRLFYGEVLGIRDVVTFHGRSVRELERAFKDSAVSTTTWISAEHAEKNLTGRFQEGSSCVLTRTSTASWRYRPRCRMKV